MRHFHEVRAFSRLPRGKIRAKVGSPNVDAQELQIRGANHRELPGCGIGSGRELPRTGA